jgi:hypothetical protein
VRIGILGCGPSGLIAAHAAYQYGVEELEILSYPNKSPIYGAQYLHGSIPDLTTVAAVKPDVIRYKMTGAPEAYLRKVYGDAWDGTVSDDLRDQAHLAHDLRAAYNELWGLYKQRITHMPIPGRDDLELRTAAVAYVVSQFDLVINTIPRPAVCIRPDEHRFVSTHIWAMGDSDDQLCPVRGTDGVIEYNGEKEPGWYRLSRIFGHTTLEWPGWVQKPPVPGVVRVSKPLRHNCDCWSDNIVHLGRMGRWQNGYLAHQVYPDTIEQIILFEERNKK